MATLPVHGADDRNRIEQLELLLHAARRVNSILELDELLDEIVGNVAETFGCNETAVLLVDELANEVAVTALRGFNDLSRSNRYRIGVEGIVGHVAATGKMHYAPDVRMDPYYVDSEPGTRSEIAIPLISRGKVIGIFDVQSPVVNGFTASQIEVLCALSHNVAIAIENARLFRLERAEKERILREQEEARMIQNALLPEQNPSVPGFCIDGKCLQARAVGGDWYDYIPLGNDRWGIVLGDVCGKGMPAALLMSATSGMMRQLASSDLSPAETLTRLNLAVLRHFPLGRFVTMIYAIPDPSSGSVTFANAGHYPPVLTGDCGCIRSVYMDHGLPLGIRNDIYNEASLTLSAGESLILYTDGVTEAMDHDGREFGDVSLAEAAGRRELTAVQLISGVVEFSATGILGDDATAIVIRRAA